MNTEALRLYPDPALQMLWWMRWQISISVDQDQVFVGVGSDDVLAMCFLTFFNSGQADLFPDITYSFYNVWADVFRIPYRVSDAG